MILLLLLQSLSWCSHGCHCNWWCCCCCLHHHHLNDWKFSFFSCRHFACQWSLPPLTALYCTVYSVAYEASCLSLLPPPSPRPLVYCYFSPPSHRSLLSSLAWNCAVLQCCWYCPEWCCLHHQHLWLIFPFLCMSPTSRQLVLVVMTVITYWSRCHPTANVIATTTGRLV